MIYNVKVTVGGEIARNQSEQSSRIGQFRQSFTDAAASYYAVQDGSRAKSQKSEYQQETA
ncbi:MAG: hypothetical protein FWF82_05345 [Oscillospiraceae bacterium]|jgi:hypothetical protein|nr:hypothetical protein [Oscillospiraceae bacterium]